MRAALSTQKMLPLALIAVYFGFLRTRLRDSAFTLVEIMIVVAIIGLLATVVIPSLMRARMDVLRTTFINDLRIAHDTFAILSVTGGTYPPSCAPGVIPPGMEERLKRMQWTAPTPIGGLWEWNCNQFGFKAGVSVYHPGRTDEEMADIDGRIDDGNINTGMFRKRADGFIYVVEY